MAVAVVGTIGVVVALLFRGSRDGASDANRPEVAGQSPVDTAEADVDWPMFHGDPHLSGRAGGTLADRLELAWRFETTGAVTAAPVIEAGVVYVGSADANVYAIDLETGEQKWATGTGDAIEAPACVVEDSVYVGAADGLLYALNKADGAVRWTYETDGQIVGGTNRTTSPDGERTWILVGSYDSLLHCVDAETGKAVWTYETDNYVNGTPAIDNGKAVFGGCDALIHVVALADGNEVRSIDSGAYIAGSGAYIEGQMYVGNYGGVFLRADTGAGKIAWEYGDEESAILSSPAVAKDVVVFGARDGNVHCVRRDNGKPVWKFKTLDEVDSSPAICQDKVIVGSKDGRLYSIRLTDGSELWSYEIGQPVTSSPAISRGMVVIGSEDNYVYAFGKPLGGRDRGQ